MRRFAAFLAAALLGGMALGGCGTEGQEASLQPESLASQPENSAILGEESSVPAGGENSVEPESDPASSAPEAPKAPETTQPVQPAPLPRQVSFQVIDRNGLPAVNAQVTFQRGEEFWGYYRCDSQGEITLSSLDGLEYGSYEVGITTVGPAGEESRETIPVELSAGNVGGVILVEMEGESLYEQVKQAENRVEICILTPDGDPIPDLWVSTNLMGDRFPDMGGLIVPGEGYTDQDGVVYFDQYDSPYASMDKQTGVKQVTIQMGNGVRPLQNIQVPDKAGVKRYTYTVDLEALPETFTLLMVDKEGRPIRNTRAVIQMGDETMNALTDQKGRVVMETQWFSQIGYDIPSAAALEWEPAGGETVRRSAPFSFTRENAWNTILVEWDFLSPYEELRASGDRVDLRLVDPDGVPLVWENISAAFGPEGSCGGYTDEEGIVSFPRYSAGEIPVLWNHPNQRSESLGTIQVANSPGIQTFTFTADKQE